MAVDGATKEKKKKKKIKVEEEEAADGGNTNVMLCRDVSVQTGVKTELLERNARDGESEEKKRKKKKKKVKEEETMTCHNASVQTSVKPESSEINISDASEKTIKKKKRKMEEPELKEEEDGEHLVSNKKKAKKKGNVVEVKGIKNKKMKKEVEVKEEEVEIETVKKKKKRKKERELNTEVEDGETKKKIKKTEADKCIEEERKVKKKKKAPVKEEPDEGISRKEKPEKKSKKQKKGVKSEDEGAHENGGHVCSPDEPSGKKGRKEELKKTPEKVEEKTFKEERDEALKKSASRANDIVFLSAKTGNQDEVSIDQARRLALQQDVDKESQPKPTLGQWGTAQFSSSAEQTKFLRLMGGLKKSSQPAAGSSGPANMALGRDGQQTLQQGLLGQFERAQSHHKDFKIRGAGLGFAAPSNKTFTIDVNARNSVRFDD